MLVAPVQTMVDGLLARYIYICEMVDPLLVGIQREIKRNSHMPEGWALGQPKGNHGHLILTTLQYSCLTISWRFDMPLDI